MSKKQCVSTLARLGRRAGSPGVPRNLTRYEKMLVWAEDPEMLRRIRERFMAHIVPSEDCWSWKGSTSPFGYGRINIIGDIWHAHRVSWVIHFGPIPRGKQVLHRCDNPSCNRPDHLFLGDDLANQKDALEKGRHLIGEQCPNHLLTEGEVRAIRREYQPRKVGRYFLGIKYGVTPSCIQAVVIRRTWKQVR